jgi:oligosaccharyl transferase complex subunit OST4
MITDSQLYSLAIFLGSAAMLLIVLYHFLEVNSEDHAAAEKSKTASGKAKA